MEELKYYVCTCQGFERWWEKAKNVRQAQRQGKSHVGGKYVHARLAEWWANDSTAHPFEVTNAPVVRI